MKRKWLKLAGILITLIIISAVMVRLYDLKRKVDVPLVEYYEMGEEVDFEDNIFWDETENADGYSIKVNQATLMTYEEYVKQYDISREEAEAAFANIKVNFPEMVVDVEITVKNKNAEDTTTKGIFLNGFSLSDCDYRMPMNSTLFLMANPTVTNGMRFALRAETEMNFSLPFAFAPSDFVNPVPVKRIKSGDFSMAISLYPIQKNIELEIKQAGGNGI